MESMIDATDRLRREGKWSEASTYRDDLRRQLRADGRPKSEASDVAWQAMIEKFPPQPVADTINVTEELDELDFEGLAVQFGGNAPDLLRDAMWVYENLVNKRATAQDAPSLGAWSLLKWARGNSNRFFEQ